MLSNNRPLWRSRGMRWGVAVAALLAVCQLAMLSVVYWRGTALLFGTLDRSVTEQLALLAARPPSMLEFMVSSRMQGGEAVVTRVGLFSADGGQMVGNLPRIPAALALDGRAHRIVETDAAEIALQMAGRVLPDGRILIVAREVSEILGVRSDIARAAAIGLIPAVLLSLGGGALVGMLSERRLRRLNLIAARVIGGDLGHRLPADPGGDELDRLCVIVNEMLEQFETHVQALGEVGENIAHDLRTPLTALRVRLERAERLAGGETEAGQAVGACLGNVDQALSTITALLRIGDIQRRTRVLAFQPVDLGAIVRETTEIFQPIAEDRGVALVADLASNAEVLGDRDLLIEALVNLVDNALKFTPRGGRVEVGVQGTLARPALFVGDNGPGIAPALRSHVQRRFARLDASRTKPGSGLGLSLVAAIAALHRFTFTIEDNAPGSRAILKCWSDAPIGG